MPYITNVLVKKRNIKLILLLGVIWFVIALPLPWLVNNPNVSEASFYTIIGIIIVISIPLVVLGIVWILKEQELDTHGNSTEIRED